MRIGGLSSPSTAGAREKASVYRAGSRVTVHYDPGNPANALLTTETSWFNRGGLVLIGALLTAIGVASVLLARRATQASARTAALGADARR